MEMVLWGVEYVVRSLEANRHFGRATSWIERMNKTKRKRKKKKRFTTGRCRWFDLVDFERRPDRSQYINWVFIVGRLAAKYPSRVLTRPSIRRYSFFRFSVIERPLRTHALFPTIRRYTLFREQLVIFDISRVIVPKSCGAWKRYKLAERDAMHYELFRGSFFWSLHSIQFLSLR